MLEQIEHNFDNVFNCLNEYADKFRELYRTKLESDGKVATGQLINNVKTVIKGQNTDYVVYLQVADYYQYLENGRKAGKFPPVNRILDWVRVKNILPTPMANGKLPTENQLAFLIGRSIAKNGIEGGHYLQSTVNDLNKEYIGKLQDALQKDFDEYSIKVWNGINKMIKI